MQEVFEKIIEKLEEKENEAVLKAPNTNDISNIEYQKWMMKSYGFKESIEIVNQLAEEYNNDFCEWTYDEFEEKWQTDCEVLFALNDSDMEITHYCPYCGKKIKIAPYQPKGE